ncbi:MAG: RNA repair transcriptional activator RtcR [Pirellulaceae bacterium]
MDKHRKTVVIGLIGSKLDSGRESDRWSMWRPTVSLCQHEDFVVDRFELLFGANEQQLAKQVSADMRSISPETQVIPNQVSVKDPWDFEEVFAAFHQFAVDYDFQPDEEQYLVHITTGTHVQQICLFLLTESRHFPAQLVQTSPARFKNKILPTGKMRIIDLDLSKYDSLATRFAQEQQTDLSFLKAGIETRSPTFNRMIERIEQVALATSAPILLTGPTGAGKTQLANRIFRLKKKRSQVVGEFVSVNCATLRGDQAMSTLFGHTKGAFTGAQQARPGLLMAADKGVLFLDEIGELGLDEQAMLLRAIEEKEFLPVGSDQTATSHFQLMAGTNRDLRQAVAEGRFREDLFARINLWTFALPGLAERTEDIEPNLTYELERFSNEQGRKVTINAEAKQAFLRFALEPSTTWSGNFRDLGAAVVRMATLAPGGRINLEIVSEEIHRLQSLWQPASAAPKNDDTTLLSDILGEDAVDRIDVFDRVQLAEVIRTCRRCKNLSSAGRTLFQASRQSKAKPNDADRLRKYLAKFNLTWSDLSGE